MLVVKEGGLEKLHKVVVDSRPYQRVKELAHYVIESCYTYDSRSDVSVSPSSYDADCSFDG